ncbi:glycosyltransferase [Faecalicatena sp. Marseille-Q4148]|nr:glycosyltransferase [Faecalicatena sp. Marseille-Q4148]
MKKALVFASVASMIQQFNMNNIRLLQELGYQVDVACNFKFGSSISDEKIRELKKTLEELHVGYYHIPVPRKIQDVKGIMKSYRMSLKLMNEQKYDLIHCHSPIGGIICRMANRRSSNYQHCKMIYTAHGFHFFKGNHPLKNLIFGTVERLGAHFTDVLLTINLEDYEAAKKFRLKKQGCIKYVPGIGMDLKSIQEIEPKREQLCNELGLSADTRLIVSVGELNKNKNHAVVVEALSWLPENFHYLICGQGDLREELSVLADSLQCGDRLHLLNYRRDVISIVKSCDYFVFPSKREGLSVALMEALVCNATCLASRIRGNTDLIYDRENGFLFDADERAAQEIYDLIQEIERKGVCFDEEVQNKVLDKIDRRNIEKDMREIYTSEGEGKM